jgi:hypothetical protein
MKLKLLSLTLLSLLLLAITACSGNSTIITRTSTSLPSGPPDLVEVDYFYESDACFCLALASEWIDTTITNDYQGDLASGELTYTRYDTKDSANDNAMAEFNATNYGFYITITKGDISSTYPVGGLWLYTDTTGENEMLKSKFIGLLKQELDKALAGE